MEDMRELKPGTVVEGPSLPEPIRVLSIQDMDEGENSSWMIAGEGLYSNQFYKQILSASQIKSLICSPAEEDFSGDPLRFKLGVEAYRLGLGYEYDPYFALSIARIDPLPHQLEAVYDYILPLPRIRFLLADDAGAGKTIMAGLLLKELKIRGLVHRTLIVTPANLAFQWKRELMDKFRELFELLRGADLRDAYGTNPLQETNQVITSMDWLKRPEVRKSIESVYWDLVIVDEAHKMSATDSDHKSYRYMLGELLSRRTDHYLLLTATPHRGDPENFCLFLQLLDKDVYGDVSSLNDAMRRNSAPFYLRRIKESMVTFPDSENGLVKKIFTDRDVKTARFDLDEDEGDFYDKLTSYVENQSIRARMDQTARGRALGFTMALYQRRFASSIYAVRRSLERRRDKLEKKLTNPKGTEETVDINFMEDLEDLPENESEELIEKLERASLSQGRASIQQEIKEIAVLIDQAKRLEQREVESKLKKLYDVLVQENIFKDPRNKLLIFTEHRDTLEYLAGRKVGKHRTVGKLEEWGLKVTQIHGGMKTGDDATEGTRLFAEREFKDEDGAQVLVATEAAGEGINLQFCWIMINYDIPWNPMRLEQRMGRIHRYGQERDCLIFNFVAMNTREGQVLERLLERLKEIQKELGTDKVFDVVGEVFPANELEKLMREVYACKMEFNDVLKRVVHDIDAERFKRITESTLEGLAKKELNLYSIVGKKELAKERRLVPEVVKAFFINASSVIGFTPTQRGSTFKIGKLPKLVTESARRLEPRFGPISKEYKWVTFDKKILSENPSIEWVTPGHPLFEGVREALLHEVRLDLRNGAIFYDLYREEPAVLDVYAASINDGRGRTLHRRLFVMETTKQRECILRQPTIFLDLSLASSDTNVPDNSEIPAKKKVELAMYQKALKGFLREVLEERTKEIEVIRRHIDISLNELINRQNLILASFIERSERGEELSGLISMTDSRINELNDRLERRKRELEQESELTVADIDHIGRAWVLPHPQRLDSSWMIPNAKVEQIAMQEASKYEIKHSRIPKDVSSENRGFDILSTDPNSGATRFIEVKGKTILDKIMLTRHEYDTAQRLGSDYWLYIVHNCFDEDPILEPIQNPAKLDWEQIVKVDHYRLTSEKLWGRPSDP